MIVVKTAFWGWLRTCLKTINRAYSDQEISHGHLMFINVGRQ